MSIRKIKLKNGQTRYQVRILLNGRGSKHLNRRFTKRSDAEAYLKKLFSDLRNPELEGNSFENTTFRQEGDFWFEFQKSQVTPGSLSRSEENLKTFYPLVGHLNPNELHPGKIVFLQKELISRGLKNNTINRKIGTIHAVLRFSARMRRIPYNPMAGYVRLKEDNLAMEFWSVGDARKFLEFADGYYKRGSQKRWVFVAYLLAVNTGLRAGEIWGLRPCEINFDNHTMRIAKQLYYTTKKLGPVKGKVPRYVPCNKALEFELRNLIQSRNLGPNELIFQSDDGFPIDHRNFTRWYFEKDLIRAKMPRIRFHDLRHTTGTLMVADGVDIVTVKEILGHRKISTSMRYLHVVASNVQKVAQNFTIAPRDIGQVIQLKTSNGNKVDENFG